MRRATFLLLSILLSVLCSFVVCGENQEKEKRYDGHSLIRIEMEEYQIEELVQKNVHFDVWRVNGRFVDVHVNPSLKKNVLTAFPNSKVIIDDLQVLIDRASYHDKKKWELGNINSSTHSEIMKRLNPSLTN